MLGTPLAFLLLALTGPLVRYEVKESVAAVTPRGEQRLAVVGRVTVAGDKALWELPSGTFPRSRAQVAVADKGGVTLLDRAEGVYASASREDFDALFVPRASAETGASFTPQEVAVSVTPEGAGPKFGSAPTVRYRVKAGFRLAMQAPGRAGAVVTELTGTILAAEGLDEARSPFDDLLRLLPVRGDVKESFARELAHVRGLPVKVELELVSEGRSEALGAPPGSAERATRPPRTVTRILRELSPLERRSIREGDAALFEVPASFHSRALERLVPGTSSLP